MSELIRVGIVGWGNLGRGVEAALRQNHDMELLAVFTRRDPGSLEPKDNAVKFLHVNEAVNFTDEVDVMVLCGGSATDLPRQGPYFARIFNTVDSFDTHAKIPWYYAAVDEAARSGDKTAAISIGWDPGLFSLNRMIAEAVLPRGEEYTFWGHGVSQGHSDAVRKVPGVKHGVQYTIPVEAAIERVRKGETPALTAREKHLRECYVVAEEGADRDEITREIESMPDYFAEYHTRVYFVTAEELAENHAGMPHGGFVIRSGKTGEEESNSQIVEFSLKLDSNPEFTASVLVAYARAVHRLNSEGQVGAKTIFDIPPGYLSARSADNLRRELL